MDQFDFLVTNNTQTSTVDDDFEALFGSVGDSKANEEEEDDGLDSDSTISTTATITTDSTLTATSTTVDVSIGSSSSDDTQKIVSGSNTLLDFGDSVTTTQNDKTQSVSDFDSTSSAMRPVALDSNNKLFSFDDTSSSSDLDSTTSVTKPAALDNNKLFSFDDNDPGLDDMFTPCSKSEKSDNDLTSKTTSGSASRNDIFDDIFAPKPRSSKSEEDKSSLDDIFFSGSSKNIETTEDSLTDIFQTNSDPKKKEEKNDPFDDIFAQPPPSSTIDFNKTDASTLDLFASHTPDITSTKPQTDKSSGDDGTYTNITKGKQSEEQREVELEHSSPSLAGLEDRHVVPDNEAAKSGTMLANDTHNVGSSDLTADLLADLPTSSTPTLTTNSTTTDAANTPLISSTLEADNPPGGSDAKGGGERMDEDLARDTNEAGGGEVGSVEKKSSVPDILDFLEDGAVDLPDVSTLEAANNNKADPFDLISHPPATAQSSNDDSTDGKRSRLSDSKEPMEEKNKDDETANSIQMSVTAPSMDLGDSLDLPTTNTTDGSKVKVKEDDGAVVADGKKSEWREQSSKLKEELQKEPDFMDFSVLMIPEESQLNVDVSKHKRSLSKKGSLALRKKPSRRAIRSTGSDGDDALFQDSTEPKPPVVSDDEEDKHDKQNDERPVAFDGGDVPPSPESRRGPFKPPMTGGVKIPGLLEGLKNAKPFKSPELKKTNNSPAADSTKAPVEKEETNFRSLLKSNTSSKTSSTSSSSSLYSKSLKDSQNQSIAQTSSSFTVKPSDLRKQPMAGSIKLPALIKTPSPTAADKLNKPPPKAKVPPPVASKPRPSLPGNKPKLFPIGKSSEQQSNGSTTNTATATSYSTMSTSASPVIISDKNKDTEKCETISSSSPSSVLDDKKSTTSAPSLSNSSSTSTISSTTKTTTSSTSSLFSSTQARPFTPAKPKPRLPLGTKPTTPDTKSSSSSSTNLPKSDVSEKQAAEDSGNKSLFINTSEKEKASSEISSPPIGVENDFTDSSLIATKPRKSSVSGMSSVQSPFGPDKSAPRKSSISGSAYAPIGFKRSISNEGSDKDKSRSESISNDDGASSKKIRTLSISESTEKEKDEEETPKKMEIEPEKKEEKSNGTKNIKDIGEDEKAQPSMKPKETPPADNRLLNEENCEKTSSGKPDTPQKPMWGVQLRKVDRKPPTSSKPSPDQGKEGESPANWRQQLANKRKSITPKAADPPALKEAEADVPEWAKASVERRKRLFETGVIKSEAK